MRPNCLTEIPVETRKANESPHSGAINATILARAPTQRLARTWDPMINTNPQID